MDCWFTKIGTLETKKVAEELKFKAIKSIILSIETDVLTHFNRPKQITKQSI